MKTTIIKYFLYGLLLSAALTIVVSPAMADVSVGKEAYEKGNYSVALQELKPMGESGDAEALYLLGEMYGEGHGVPKNEIEAASWYMKAARKGHVEAQLKLSQIYGNGTGVEKDDVIAAYWQWRAAENFAASENTRINSVSPKKIIRPSVNFADFNDPKTMRCEKKDVACSCKRPKYPNEALRLNQQGTVDLLFLIDPTGNVLEVTVAKSSGTPLLDKTVRDAFSMCHFNPGTENGRPVTSIARLQYVWRID